MVKAIRVHETGGPEVLKYEDIELPDPGPGEVRIKHAAIGINFIDTYFRTGLYAAPAKPFTLGNEAAGTVTALGKGASGFKVGDRVAYVSSLRSYAEEANVPDKQVMKLPKSISFDTAAGMMLKGMTAEYLLRRTYKVREGDTVLVHAAAGGVGLLFGQWAKARGYKVIGTVSSPEKAALAKKNGYKWVIDYTKQNIVDEVKKITKGKGVPVVVDGVGKDTWAASLDCLQPRGLMISFGNASGPVPPVALGILNTKGSLYVTRPSLAAYTANRKALKAAAKSVFKMVKSGKVKIAIDQRYPLGEAAQAHRDLESRKTTGQTILVP